MKPSEFTNIEDSLPEEFKHVIVTNNINCTNAHGEMSHVWMTTFLQKSSDFKQNGYITFDAADRQIYNITHWKYA